MAGREVWNREDENEMWVMALMKTARDRGGGVSDRCGGHGKGEMVGG